MRLSGDTEAATSYTYVTQQRATSINQYRTNNSQNSGPVCTVLIFNAGPQGIATDQRGILYVAMVLGQQFGVATFRPNCGRPGPTYVDPDGIPDAPLVDGTTLYLSNLTNTGQKPATVDVYRGGVGAFPARLSEPSVIKGIGLAADSHHNVFWSTTAQLWSDGQVVEFKAGKMPGVVLKATRIGSDFPGNVMVDRIGNLLLVNQTHPEIYVYAPPYTSPAFDTIPLKGTTLNCTLGLRQTRLYCLDYEFGSVDIYAYPAGTYLYSYTNGISASEDPIGIAIQAPAK